MKRWMLLLFLLLMTPAMALKDPDMFLYNELQLELTIDNEVIVQTDTSDYYIEFVSANLSWFPRDDFRQRILSLTTTPKAEKGQNIEFLWNTPSGKKFPLKVQSSLITKNEFVRVTQKEPFPIKKLPSGMRPYLEPGIITDTNEDIRKQAAILAEDKDDLYEVVFALGDWTKESIHYNLSTITADASQKSSWVLKKL